MPPKTSATKDKIIFNDGTVQSNSFPMIGSIIIWAGLENNIPENYEICSGNKTLDQIEYADLYSVIGDKYTQTPNSTTFDLPNFDDRYPKGYNSISPHYRGNLYGGTNTINESHFKHKHNFDKSGFFKSYAENKADKGNSKGYNNSGDKGRIKNISTDYNSDNSEGFKPKYVAIKYIIKVK
tara:strand:+ start:744 stop:1286 length:543 start_codon:yes stop_codon:yes gene_type:complete